MSSKLQPVRGTHDILPDEFEKFHAVVTRARELATLYGFKEMATPIFEPTEVFSRSMGETSDVVSKEMFSFETKGGESVTLRPEFTAGIVRAFLSNGMQQHLPLKLFSTGPLFRYERPQKGRQRQFHQVNFEWLGDASLNADLELICLAGHLLYTLSGRQACTLLINTLGDSECRAKYKDALVAYLSPYSKELSDDSQRRLISNPLRILDSKSEQDKKLLQNAPTINEYLSVAERERFEITVSALRNKDVPFFQKVIPTPSLVRGLDYYTGTVFEFISESGDLGAQNTVLAGGRYDGLVEQMGGKLTPAIGFAAGVERLLLLMEQWTISKDIKVVLLPLEDINPDAILLLSAGLRNHFLGLQINMKQQATVEVFWHGSLKKRMERASQQKASHVIIFGEEEAQRNACTVRNMETREQQEIKIDDLFIAEKLRQLFGFDKLTTGLRRNDEAQS